MMEPKMTAILIPSLWRAKALGRVIDNIRATTPEPHAIYTVVDKADPASQRQCQQKGVQFWTDDAGYFVQRIQFLFEHTEEPWIFTGSDDIIHSPGWLSGCFEVMEPWHKICCPNDGHNAKGTNYLVERDYIMEQGGNFNTPGFVYHPDYLHNFSDDEMVNTGIYRGVYTRAWDVVVESTHPTWGNAPMDDTYMRMYTADPRDRALYYSRWQLWGERDLWR
jgi:hypothetical protein